MRGLEVLKDFAVFTPEIEANYDKRGAPCLAAFEGRGSAEIDGGVGIVG